MTITEDIYLYEMYIAIDLEPVKSINTLNR